MNSRASHLLVVLLLTVGLITQSGLFGTRRQPLATLGSFSAAEDSNPVDDSSSEEEDDRGEGPTRDESAFGLRLSPFLRRGLAGPLSRLTLPHSHRNRLSRTPGTFRLTGSELRRWIQSPRC